MKQVLAIFIAAALALGATPLRADDRAIEAELVENADGTRTLVHTAIIDAPPEKVWEAFSTLDGWKSWGVSFAAMDVRPGGTIESSYVPGAEAGDEGNIVHRILAMIPNRLMVMRVESGPDGTVDMDVLGKLWAVYELEALADGRTRLISSGYGYGDDPQSERMIAFFTEGNKQSIAMMRAAMEAASDD